MTAGLTQEQTAEAANITAIYLSKIENGRVMPTLKTLCELCSVLGLDIGAVLSGCQPQQSNYENDMVTSLFNACSPQIKPVALKILKALSEIEG